MVWNLRNGLRTEGFGFESRDWVQRSPDLENGGGVKVTEEFVDHVCREICFVVRTCHHRVHGALMWLVLSTYARMLSCCGLSCQHTRVCCHVVACLVNIPCGTRLVNIPACRTGDDRRMYVHCKHMHTCFSSKRSSFVEDMHLRPHRLRPHRCVPIRGGHALASPSVHPL
jgi:hypothetical protein